LDSTIEDFADKAISHALSLKCNYCDVRAEIITKEGLVIENGQIEYTSSMFDKGLGIRVLNDGAWGFFSVSSPALVSDVIAATDEAISSARYYSSKKKQKIRLVSVPAVNDKLVFPVRKESDIETLAKIGFDCDKIIHEKKRIIKSSVSIGYGKTKKYFASSEGSKITQEYADVVAELSATAHESGLTQSVDSTEGGRGGIEKLSDQKDIFDTARFVSEMSSNLIDAKPASDEKATVVMNPDFVSLLTHEILGHPSEADRVLGKEMAWAGGAWWAGNIGKQIGSQNLDVFDDPTIQGSLGWYGYDDEGVKSTKTTLIEDGVLVNHMQNRETAEIFHAKPSANMRATSYKFMPLIRMACTCIGKGDWDPQEMIRDVKSGYLVSNMKVPSIDMKRYNWSISCQFAQKIENGELTDLLRDVIVIGTAPEFFKSIDACGNDFTVRPITNCGKGDPMQSMIMGNGGPTIRAVATVKSVKS
jgi:TldD protein